MSADRPGRHRPAVAITALVMVVMAACGGDGDPVVEDMQDPAASAPFPVTVEADNGPVEITSEPGTIVSLSPSATEILFAIDAGDQVVAVDDQSDYPDEAPTTDLSGFEPNIEAIAGYEPDLVIYATDPGDLESSLEKLSIPALQHNAPAEIDGALEQVVELGRATGRVEEADELVSEMQEEIDGIVGSLPDTAGLTYYHELDPTFFTATEESFIGSIYDVVGLSNIAEGVKGASAGYVQLSEEHIIDSDPDLIFLADSVCCGQSADTVAARPGWKQISAVSSGHVFEVPDDIASRWGPRITEFLSIVGDAVEAATG